MKTLSIIALISALRAVESSGGTNSKANGNDLQIEPVCVEDCNRILKSYGIRRRYTLSDRKDKRKSAEMAILYMTYWGDRVTKNPTAETYARIFHRGPRNWNDELGRRYWLKVKGKLNSVKE